MLVLTADLHVQAFQDDCLSSSLIKGTRRLTQGNIYGKRWHFSETTIDAQNLLVNSHTSTQPVWNLRKLASSCRGLFLSLVKISGPFPENCCIVLFKLNRETGQTRDIWWIQVDSICSLPVAETRSARAAWRVPALSGEPSRGGGPDTFPPHAGSQTR